MLSPEEKHALPPCPKENESIERRRPRCWVKWLFPLSGLLALIWFLVRVIPKPSRATYPCQRMAFPMASGFVIWLAGAIASIAAVRKAKRSFAQSRYVLCAILLAGSISAIDEGVRNLVASGVSIPAAVGAASRNPLALLGVRDRGRIAPGQIADLLVLDGDLAVDRVMKAGVWVS